MVPLKFNVTLGRCDVNLTVIGIAVGVIMALFGILHAIQNGRLGRLEEGKADKEVVERMEDCLVGKGGIKETLIRVDERVTFLWKTVNGKEKGNEKEISESD